MISILQPDIGRENEIEIIPRGKRTEQMIQEDVTIRMASPEDAEELLAIYAPYVEQTAVTYEYDVPAVEEFAARIERTLERYPYLAAVRDGEILGYAYAGRLHERSAYDWSVELSIYVKWDVRGQGIGKKLYQALEQALVQQGIVHAAACIAYPEQEDEYLTFDSVRFHEKMGYTMVGQFHGCAYKFNRWYGMAWMEKQIGRHLEEQPPVRWREEPR
jgi:phosphinothricin acetyltransferase